MVSWNCNFLKPGSHCGNARFSARLGRFYRHLQQKIDILITSDEIQYGGLASLDWHGCHLESSNFQFHSHWITHISILVSKMNSLLFSFELKWYNLANHSCYHVNRNVKSGNFQMSLANYWSNCQLVALLMSLLCWQFSFMSVVMMLPCCCNRSSHVEYRFWCPSDDVMH